MFASSSHANRRAFTLIELLVSIGVLSALIAIVFVGARAVMKNARSTADRQTLLAMRTGIEQFKQEFGFLPPLIQDEAISGFNRTWSSGQSVGKYPVELDNSSNENRIVTFSFALANRGSNIERDYLRGYINGSEMDPNSSAVGYGNAGPNADRRFSTYSLATYLNAMGETPLVPANKGNTDKTIDGIPGPEMTTPRDDGSFAVSGGNSTTTKKYGAFFDGGRRGLTLVGGSDASGTATGLYEFRDRNGKPIRYYRWLRGKVKGVSPTPSDKIDGLADLAVNVPSLLHALHPKDFTGTSASGMLVTPGGTATKLMAMRADYDLNSNATLKSADFALVAAGPDGTFGDAGTEGGADGISKSLGASYGTDLDLLKIRAREDNIVEAGR